MSLLNDWLSHWQQRTANSQHSVYALLDGAQDEKLLQQIWQAHPNPKVESLFLHTTRAELAEQGPWLLQLDTEPALWSELLTQLEHRPLGILIGSPAPLAELAKHLRNLLDARLADGDLALLRFYDPQVVTGLTGPACAYWNAQAIRAGEAWAAWLPLEQRDCLLQGPEGTAAPLPLATSEVAITPDMQQALARASEIPRLLGQLQTHYPQPLERWTVQDRYQWALRLNQRLHQHGITDKQDRLFLAVLELDQGERIWEEQQMKTALERKQISPELALSELLQG